MKSRANALKHGLRAEVLAMPGEDPEYAAQLLAEWNDHYRPDSPAARQLVFECVQATLFIQRVAAHQVATAEAQYQKTREQQSETGAEEIERLVQRLEADPAATIATFKSTVAGCRWLRSHWKRVAARLDGPDGWLPVDVGAAAILLGGIAARPISTLAAAARRSKDPNNRDAADARAQLDQMIDEELESLRATEANLVGPDDSPQSAQAAALAIIPADPALARLYLRYQIEARTAFDRAWKALRATLDRDAAERQREAEVMKQEEDAAADSPDEAASEGGDDGSPNEAKARPSRWNRRVKNRVSGTPCTCQADRKTVRRGT